MEQKKENFGSKVGFILAAAGSAVGLGNIWRFPYLAAKYGGGIFLLVYLILACTFGFALMTTEIAIGRKTKRDCLSAYGIVHKNFKAAGGLAALIPFIIAPYYCVIGGWVLKYMVTFISGQSATTADDGTFFTGFIGQLGGPAIFFIIYLALNLVVILLGVQKGIEKISKFLMPALVVIIVGICIYTMSLPGALEGVKYYLLPNFSAVTGTGLLKTIGAAAGQMFYSMSLAMGIMITYGSYMRKEDSIESSVRNIEIFDTGIAFLAGLIIVPAVFIFSNGDASALNAGPSLMFITMPNVFSSMKGGAFIGAAFFVLVLFAALTSSISLLETNTAVFMDTFKMKRTPATILVFVITVAMGMLSVLGYSAWDSVTIFGMQFLDFFDFISNNILMPIMALVTCILIGYVVKTAYVEDEVIQGQEKFNAKHLYRFVIKFVCPIGMIVVLLTSLFVSF